MGIFDEIWKSVDSHHNTQGQIDASKGSLPTDVTNTKYMEGYRAGQFEYDKNNYGETYARVAKTERDWVNSSPSLESSGSSGGGGGSYSGEGSSGGGGGGGSGSNGSVGCLGTIAAGILFLFLGIGGLMNYKPSRQPKPAVTQMSLEENVKRLSEYLRANNQLSGNFEDYQLVIPPGSTEKECEVAYIGSSAFYVFHSSDWGKTWNPQPGTNPYLQNLAREWEKNIREKAKKQSDPISELEEKLKEMSKKGEISYAITRIPRNSDLDLGFRAEEEKIEERAEEQREKKFEEPVNTYVPRDTLNYDSYEYPTLNRLDRRIIPSFRRFVEPADIVDLHDGSVAIQLGKGPYHRLSPEDLGRLNSIYQSYGQRSRNILGTRKRYVSSKEMQRNMMENLKTDLRRVIMNCEEIEYKDLLARQ